MKNPFKQEGSGRYVELKSPKNKRYLLLILAMAIFVGVLVTSNMWLPDGRRDVTTHSENKAYQFSASELIVERVAYNPTLMIGEVRVKEKINNAFNYKDLEFGVVNDKKTELPMKVIQSEFTSTSKDNKSGYKWTLIQFTITPEYYYFTLNINDKGYAQRGISFDYRKVPHVELIEKGDDYLKTAPALFMSIDLLQTQVETLERKIQDIEPEVNKAKNELELASDEIKAVKQKAYDTLVADKTQLETEHKAKTAELKQYTDKLEEREKQ
ncbi:hypothetical protein [Erysipelothrix aquatica]|uniref:hypothetical protein n=1 Tax=Erysipelothrix aquatica TaxID=2683714 RepID=UPI001356C1D6|nr:hypothetical protein [Erysipelothrix aquatica]